MLYVLAFIQTKADSCNFTESVNSIIVFVVAVLMMSMNGKNVGFLMTFVIRIHRY